MIIRVDVCVCFTFICGVAEIFGKLLYPLASEMFGKLLYPLVGELVVAATMPLYWYACSVGDSCSVGLIDELLKQFVLLPLSSKSTKNEYVHGTVMRRYYLHVTTVNLLKTNNFLLV